GSWSYVLSSLVPPEILSVFPWYCRCRSAPLWRVCLRCILFDDIMMLFPYYYEFNQNPHQLMSCNEMLLYIHFHTDIDIPRYAFIGISCLLCSIPFRLHS